MRRFFPAEDGRSIGFRGETVLLKMSSVSYLGFNFFLLKTRSQLSDIHLTGSTGIPTRDQSQLTGASSDALLKGSYLVGKT